MNFEYHVYLPGKSDYDEKRFENKVVISDKIHDYKVGDVYYYHIPIYLDGNEIITDYGETINAAGKSKSKDGLLNALYNLSLRLKDNTFLLPDSDFKILQSFGFLDENKKLNLGIIGNVKVEKYLLSIKPDKKLVAVEYLNSKEGVIEDRAEKEQLEKAKKELEIIKKINEDQKKEMEELKKEQDKKISELMAELRTVKSTMELYKTTIKENKDDPKKKIMVGELKKEFVGLVEKEEEIKEEIEEINDEVKEKIENIKEEAEEKINDVKGESKTVSLFNYDENKNLFENLISNGYVIEKFVRNGIGGTKPVDIMPMILINHSSKKFYVIVDSAGVKNVLEKNDLHKNNQDRFKTTVDALKNADLSEQPLSEREKAYLTARKVEIVDESPIVLKKSSNFYMRDIDIENRLKKFL